MAESDKVWGHAATARGHFIGTFDSREHAIEDGRATYGAAEAFWISAGKTPRARAFMPDVDTIIEMIGERAFDAHRDTVGDFPEVSEEARKEQVLLAQWADKHLDVTFWAAVGEPERIEAESVAEAPATRTDWNRCPRCEELVDADDVSDGSEVHCVNCDLKLMVVGDESDAWLVLPPCVDPEHPRGVVGCSECGRTGEEPASPAKGQR